MEPAVTLVPGGFQPPAGDVLQFEGHGFYRGHIGIKNGIIQGIYGLYGDYIGVYIGIV